MQPVYDILIKASLLHHHRPPVPGLAQFAVGPSKHRFVGTLWCFTFGVGPVRCLPCLYTGFVGKTLQTIYDILIKASLLHHLGPLITGLAQFGV